MCLPRRAATRAPGAGAPAVAMRSHKLVHYHCRPYTPFQLCYPTAALLSSLAAPSLPQRPALLLLATRPTGNNRPLCPLLYGPPRAPQHNRILQYSGCQTYSSVTFVRPKSQSQVHSSYVAICMSRSTSGLMHWAIPRSMPAALGCSASGISAGSMAVPFGTRKRAPQSRYCTLGWPAAYALQVGGGSGATTGEGARG